MTFEGMSRRCQINGWKADMDRNQKVRARIAVADDHPEVRRTFVQLLEQLGYQVVCAASNGAELVDQCATQEVDVAFVDFDMPVMDGLAAAAEVTKQGIPVVLLSGHPDAQDIVLEHEPVVARLLKPATVTELQNAIAFALSSRR
jgi:CheY-like chemotaxis protein